jgi:hypothetical protein
MQSDPLLSPSKSMAVISQQLQELFEAVEVMSGACDFGVLSNAENQKIREAIAGAQGLIRQMGQMDSPLNGVQWNPARALPSPGAPLVLRLTNNLTLAGIRPRHIKSYESGDLGYRDTNGNPVLDVVAWRYQ